MSWFGCEDSRLCGKEDVADDAKILAPAPDSTKESAPAPKVYFPEDEANGLPPKCLTQDEKKLFLLAENSATKWALYNGHMMMQHEKAAQAIEASQKLREAPHWAALDWTLRQALNNRAPGKAVFPLKWFSVPLMGWRLVQDNAEEVAAKKASQTWAAVKASVEEKAAEEAEKAAEEAEAEAAAERLVELNAAHAELQATMAQAVADASTQKIPKGRRNPPSYLSGPETQQWLMAPSGAAGDAKRAALEAKGGGRLEDGQ
jgi:hypothetical protein